MFSEEKDWTDQNLNSSIFRASVCVRCCNFNAAKSFFNVINFVGILCFKQIRKSKWNF